MRNELPIGEKFSFSTSVCEILGIYLPSINLVNVTVYRPPNSNFDNFNQVISKLRTWLSNLEDRKIFPTIIVNGDFNFRFMSDWSYQERVSFMNTIDTRLDDGKTFADEKKQARLLCDVIQDLFLNQYIFQSTRGDNIFDLMFTNDVNLLTSQEI